MKRNDFIKSVGAIGAMAALNLGASKKAFAENSGANAVEDNDHRLRLDVHTHIIARDEKKHKCFISKRMRNGFIAKLLPKKIGVGSTASDEEFDVAYAEYFARKVKEAIYIDKVVAFAMDGLYDSNGKLDPRTDALISNDWAMEVCKQYPDQFLFGASIHPARPDALDELDRCAEAGAVCVKWIPNSQNIEASDRKYEKFYERMKQHGLVLTSHTGYEHGLSTVDQSLGDPLKLRLPLEMGLTVVACHSGTSGWQHKIEYFPNFVKMVEKYEKLYGDTAAITDLYRAPYRKRLLNTPVVKDRIIQGSDFPIPPQATVWPMALGPVKAIKMEFIDNPFDKDYLVKKAVGFPEEHFRRGHDVFLKK